MQGSGLCGVLSPIPTPFDEEGAIDRAALARNLAWWNGHGLAGYVVLGSNGEAVHLDESEKLGMIEAVRSATPDERPLGAGTGLQSTARTIALTRRAASAGASFALVLPPSYYRGLMSSGLLAEHFERLADASAIPIVVYNMSANTGIDLDARTVIRLAEHERIVGIKDSSGNVAKLAEIRAQIALPVGVGFGIKDAETARNIARIADAVVVGSALVSRVEANAESPDKILEEARELIGGMRRAMDAG